MCLDPTRRVPTSLLSNVIICILKAMQRIWYERNLLWERERGREREGRAPWKQRDKERERKRSKREHKMMGRSFLPGMHLAQLRVAGDNVRGC